MIKVLNISFFLTFVFMGIGNINIFADSCEQVVFSPSLEKLITKTNEAIKIFNEGSKICSNQVSCEPNTIGICYANATLDAFTGYQVSPQPVYTAILSTIKDEGQNSNAEIAYGDVCSAFSTLIDQKKICDSSTFNTAYPEFGRFRPLDYFIDSFTGPNTSTSASYIKTILTQLLGIVVVNEKAKLKKLFHETFNEVNGVIIFHKEKYNDMIEEYYNFLKQEKVDNKEEIDHIENLLNSFVTGDNFKNFSKFQQEVKFHLNSNNNKINKKIATQALIIERLCDAASAFKDNPYYNLPIDHYYNMIGDDKSESEITQLLFKTKIDNRKGSSNIILPDFVGVDLNKIKGIEADKPAWHAMSVLGQTWLPANYFGSSEGGSCALVLKDSNPYYSKEQCHSRLKDKVYSVFDSATHSCYYFYPKYSLLTAKNKIMSYYCHLGSAQSIAKAKAEIKKIKN